MEMVQHVIIRDDEQPTRRATNPDLEAVLGHEYRVLDKGFIRLVDYMGTDASIVQAARVSYGAGTKSVSEDSGLISYLMRHRHTSPFEMCELKFHCKLPIFVARQWIRHRTANVNELSARYSIIKDEFWMPDLWRGQAKNNKQGSEGEVEYNPSIWELAGLNNPDGGFIYEAPGHKRSIEAAAFEEYNFRIENGIGRELARSCLPMSTYTEWYWKIDLHNLMHFLKLRCDKHAQKEIRDYADAIAAIVEIGYPITWGHFQNHVLNAVTFSADEMQWVKLGGACINYLPEIEADLGKSRALEFRKKMGLCG